MSAGKSTSASTRTFSVGVNDFATPGCAVAGSGRRNGPLPDSTGELPAADAGLSASGAVVSGGGCCAATTDRSEEHTSELQSLMRISYAVFCLKKKKNTINTIKQDK